MFRSLRFRVPALFLAGIVLAGLVATSIALRLFQDFILESARADLRRESLGVTRLYEQQAIRSNTPVSTKQLEQATGDQIFYVPRAAGIVIDPGQRALKRLPPSFVDVAALEQKPLIEFEFMPPGDRRTFLGAARPLKLGSEGTFFGAIVVGRPKAQLRETVLRLLERLGLAFLVATLIAAALAGYLSRRITRPVLALSDAADEVARGRYGVEVPVVPGGDEVGHLADRFRDMAARLAQTDERERNFLMSVSHELRTPLTAIRGHVEALREGVVEDPDARAESLDVIAAEAERLERLVGDVLDLAKLDADRFTVLREEVDMHRLCEQAYSAFGEEARRRGIYYSRDVSARPVIVTDGDRVLQMISNLLANAFGWTHDCGRIERSLASANGTVQVEVEDSGPGIAADQRERIFRPFFSQDGGGTGLGLAIARELALALGGSVEVESEPGAGSRFRLVLPTNPG